MEITSCPNCSQPIKSGWGGNKITSQKTTNFINVLLDRDSSAYCEKCSTPLENSAKELYYKEQTELSSFIKSNINLIPILTTHTPYGWQYDSVSIITGQSVTGTGFISEFKSSFTDFFGAQSGSFNTKISEGEKLCFAQLRSKALQIGAHAVIATDIDYSDVGTGKGMLLVCAAGTAIRLKNPDILGEAVKIIDDTKIKNERLAAIEVAHSKYEQLF